MTKPLMNQIAIITGAGSGIGEATARELARLGAVTVLAGRTEKTLLRVVGQIEQSGGRALAIPTDVTQADQISSLVERTMETFGQMDILINNAGSAAFEAIAESDLAAWWGTVEVNLFGTYLCTKFALPPMLNQGRGHIVNILSVAARTPFTGASAYCAAKAAGLMFTQVLAKEVRSQGIRVTAVLPGSVQTPWWDKFESSLNRSKMMPPERVAETVAFVLTQPEGAVVDEVMVLPPMGIL